MSALPANPASVLLLALFLAVPALSAEPGTGTVRFEPQGDEKAGVPERYRLDACTFDYTLSPRFELKTIGVEVFDLTFPSPVKSGIPENDTVHAEYFRPKGKGPFPAVIVLDILDGAALVSRTQAVWLSQHGVAALCVYMAHYGPRKSLKNKARLLSTDIPHTIEAIRQTVLDCRCATAWLAARPEVDANRLGLIGTSLGSLVGTNVAAGEPRLRNVCLLLPGGGLVDAFYDHPLAAPYRPVVNVLGGKETMKRIIAPVDPITYGPLLKQRNLLMIAASRDDIIPPSAATALWAASGKPQIIWYDTTHVGLGLHLVPALVALTAHVKGEPLIPGDPRP